MTDNDLKALLDQEATRINSTDFIALDPVQFPRKFTSQPDIEITALLAATLAWGNRAMICRNCERLMTLMDYQPYRYVMDQGYEDLDASINIHRTFFGRNLQNYLRALRQIYTRHPTLDDFAHAVGASASQHPAWTLAQAIGQAITDTSPTAQPDSRCIPSNLKATALKRLNMALRWLVRDDGIVDIGIWKSLRPAQLSIPLDVHVADTSRQLGLLTRRSPDRKAVEEITAHLRRFRPHDPVFYDFALFGIGMNI